MINYIKQTNIFFISFDIISWINISIFLLYTAIQLNKGDLTWHCPSCGNIDENEMQVMGRTCGYIGTNVWNKGRTAEIGDRVLHL